MEEEFYQKAVEQCLQKAQAGGDIYFPPFIVGCFFGVLCIYFFYLEERSMYKSYVGRCIFCLLTSLILLAVSGGMYADYKDAEENPELYIMEKLHVHKDKVYVMPCPIILH